MTAIETLMFLLGLLGLLVALVLTSTGFFMKSVRKTLSAVSFGLGYYNTMVNMNNPPLGARMQQAQSPNGAYTVSVYLDEGGGVTGEAWIRGEVVYHEQHNRHKTIYWAPAERKTTVTWIDKQTVSIDGHRLNVLHDTYDARHNPWF